MSTGPLWIFAYGSLMWRPEFPIVSATPARLSGYHRALCIRSTHYRGTRERPGLVFGLDRGGVCDGIAFEVAASDAARALVGLRQRELIYGVYREVKVPIEVRGRSGWHQVDAVTYVAERAHGSYAGRLAPVIAARILRQARGLSGSNLAYLAHTLQHLRRLGLIDRCLERVAVLATPLAVQAGQEGDPAVRVRWP
jgi:glutathione-specific gamma-glutamylcyclotransferase